MTGFNIISHKYHSSTSQTQCATSKFLCELHLHLHLLNIAYYGITQWFDYNNNNKLPIHNSSASYTCIRPQPTCVARRKQFALSTVSHNSLCRMSHKSQFVACRISIPWTVHIYYAYRCIAHEYTRVEYKDTNCYLYPYNWNWKETFQMYL